MAYRSFSARELLHLRHGPQHQGVADRLAGMVEADFELEEIIRTGSAQSLIVEESSGSLSDLDERINRASARQLDGNDSERKYRDRTDSEHERVPTNAPADLSAQRAEGFQKFYNAVVSPTHVRVTAGGRIVPNTRGSQSPTSKWQRIQTDGSANARPMHGMQPDGVPYPILSPGWGPFAPMVPAHAPGSVAGMGFRPEAYPPMPTPMGYGMPGPFTMQPMPYNQFPISHQAQQPTNGPQVVNQNDMNASDQVKSIQISPAEQFDPTRPFLYNGQWLVAHGNNLYPLNLMPQLGLTPVPMTSQPVTSPNGDFNAAAQRPAQAPPRQLASPIRLRVAPRASTKQRSMSPPMSSIRPSSITKKQLEVLRSQKRYHQDQLQYNKHQIDHKDMEERLQTICREIEHFEQMLENQLKFEARKYPKVEVQKDFDSSSSQGYARSDAESESPVVPRMEPQSATKNQSARGRAHVRSVTGINSTKSTAAFASAKSPNHAGNGNRAPQRKPSSLPIGAALAPVFQPRAETSNPSLATTVPDEPVPVQYTHLTSKGGSHWQSFFKKAEAAKNYGTPYLTGKLTVGVEPETARDTDYSYSRELTEDEHRARHMYWGKAPHHLQQGLPKYDGKHFYPASPIKGNSADTAESTLSAQGHLKRNEESNSRSTKTSESDPFHAIARAGKSAIRNRLDEATRSESLHREEDSLRGSSASELPRSESYATQPSPRYLAFRQMVNEKTRASSENLRAKISDDSGDEDGSLLFKGRRVMDRTSTKHPNDIWSNMRKKGKTSANVIASKVSPMTAQGVLPHYTGHAAASLTPAIANTTPNSRGSSAKLGEANEIGSANTGAEKRGENRPPTGLLEHQMRSVSLQDKNHRGFSTR
ncbi:hypothetical protein FZEAL_7751 [Fusarium zealandicum]|uniref:Uncharacterized protein n=1 Tax=Fusarium zealandicum TaxID=1053134 RepID=A0A8H4UF80_9HYPO|nr:hypothetical protein FZEAL_7751 [Fusarium zealandicum]